MPTALARVLRFGTFEVDVEARALRKAGLEVKLQEQPRQVLRALLERPGQVVTREELRQRLWPDGTFVDFEHSLNTAVKKLRDALGDEADNPRFVETVPLRGYRFCSPVEHLDGHREQEEAPAPPRRPLRRVVTGSAVLLAVAVVAVAWMSRPPRRPKIVGSTQLTYSGRVMAPEVRREVFHPLLTDGTRIYFSEFTNPIKTSQVLAAGGEIQPLPLPFPDLELLHLSPDGSQLLLCQRQAFLDREGPLWIVPTLGGAPRRLGDVMAHAGAWSPDGRRIGYARADGVFVANADGTALRPLASVRGRAAWLRWSPDGRRLRFTVVDAQTQSRSLWEVSAEGSGLHPLLSRESQSGDACCGEWTPDGRHFVFRWARQDRPELWLLSEETLFHPSPPPVRLTTGPQHLRSAVPSRDGRRLFVVVGAPPRWETLRFDLRSREFKPVEADRVGRFSRDGGWVAYVESRGEETVLWRRRVDGSERLQLTTPPLKVYFHEWSPDGKRIVFVGKRAGQPWKAYLIGADGGTPQALLDWDLNQADPCWSPDGRSVMFGHPPDYMAESGVAKAIRVVDLGTQRVSTLPGSEGLFSPRWSPDGRYVAAMPLDQSKVVIFDFATRTWSELIPGRERDRQPEKAWQLNNPFWSRDGRLLYVQNFGEHNGPLYSVRTSDRAIDRIFDLDEIKRSMASCTFWGLALDGSPLGSCSLSSSDVYALEWDAY
jgi:DNA-binding winged helix-turn-helix (wHTH) protein/Tol biopolymer transport system component